MNDRFSIIISDINGSKHYSITYLIKKILIKVIIGITILIWIGIGFLVYLNNHIDNLEIQNEKLKNRTSTLKERNQRLSSSISNKLQELTVMTNKIGDFEVVVGIKPNSDLSLNKRVSKVHLSTKQRHLILTQIPNGYPIIFKGITGKFGQRIHPITNKRKFHTGIDLKAKMDTAIRAVANGVVNFAAVKKNSGYGLLLIVDHNYGFKTLIW